MRRLLLLLVVVVSMTASAETPSVTLDVKDADVRVILKSMQRQCGIKNLLIDRDVNGAGTIYFRKVSCDTAFRTVFRQFSLKGQVEQNLVHVEPRSH